MTHAERMAEIKQREQAATAGPWELFCFKGDNGERFASCVASEEWIDIIDTHLYQCARGDEQKKEVCSVGDIDFIAHARADIPYLVARVEELEAANKAMRDAFTEWYSVPAFKETQYSFDCPEWEAFVAAMNDSYTAARDGEKDSNTLPNNLTYEDRTL